MSYELTTEPVLLIYFILLCIERIGDLLIGSTYWLLWRVRFLSRLFPVLRTTVHFVSSTSYWSIGIIPTICICNHSVSMHATTFVVTWMKRIDLYFFWDRLGLLTHWSVSERPSDNALAAYLKVEWQSTARDNEPNRVCLSTPWPARLEQSALADIDTLWLET